MLAHDGPVLVDAQVTKNENCYPMVAPGKSNAQMLGIPLPETPHCQATLVCSVCGSHNSQEHKFCSECGSKL